ncbi:MAG TPA: 3-deoxy-D-manno-octulosonic acid transferase, partial [Blastocatellia bacterium]|nr:3-deoxy-D-manno-octulosonic acid transferase [Blastocatellia bacterium]
FPNYRLIVSTTTMTGQAVARERLPEADGVCYFPFDWKFTVRRALNSVQPKVVILMESELWLNFLDECHARQIPTIVVNGRISDRSFPRSQKFGFFVRRLYGLLTRFLAQSRIDAERALALGAPTERVSVSGNLKYDIGDQSPKIEDVAQQLDAMFALAASPLIVAGSTGEDEERRVLEAFAQMLEMNGLSNTRLLMAPRHPERFSAVAALLETSGMKVSRRSAANDAAKEAQIILLDSIGELAAIYRFASLVFVGGSLVPVGGHNILEAALFAKPIIVGPHMHNFRDITKEFLRREALIQLHATNAAEQVRELRRSFAELLRDQARARQLGANARQAIEDNRGATTRTVQAIAELIEG